MMEDQNQQSSGFETFNVHAKKNNEKVVFHNYNGLPISFSNLTCFHLMNYLAKFAKDLIHF
jgi:hypothetical protein